MAIYRNVHLSFWEDAKVADDFTPEDKYFMLWLLTNPKTNLIGCYEISFKKAQLEIGYTKDSIEMLLKRMEDEHKVIMYDKETREVLMFNWHKYNWTSSIKLDKPIINGIKKIKSDKFREMLINTYKNSKRSIPYPYPMDTTDTDTDTDTVTDTVTDNIIKAKKEKIAYDEILNYLNSIKKGRKPYTLTHDTRKKIKARWEEGFRFNDFKTAIDNSFEYWSKLNDLSNLKPYTLFDTRFESRLTGDAYNWNKTKKNRQPDWYEEHKREQKEGFKKELHPKVKEMLKERESKK